MNPEIKAQWLAALRSGEFEQGKSKLAHRTSPNANTKYCCLGVLCELAVRAGISTKSEPRRQTSTDFTEEIEAFAYDGEEGFLSVPVAAWAGLEDNNPRALPTGDDDECRLSYLNDSLDKTFAEIADLIESSDI